MKETAYIKTMFDKIVKRYDFLNHLFSFGQDIIWRKKMAKEAIISSENCLVLDLASGTGDSAKELLKRGGKVIAVDISYEMLKVAKKKLKNQIFICCASSYQLPFADESFDAVTCAFGIRNMHDTEKALKEIHRVIKREGRVVILEFSLPKRLLKDIYLIYLKKIIPLVSSIFSVRSAYEYLGSSIENFYEPSEFLNLLMSIGFKNIKAIPLSLGSAYIYMGEKI